MSRPLISIIIPVYNEELNVRPFFEQTLSVIAKDHKNKYEVVYVNDGSKDSTLAELHKLANKYKMVKIVNLSRNFGKEIAITAGIHHAKGDALIMIDGDGQHPAELIPDFIAKWHEGYRVVVGVRKSNKKEGAIKKYGSRLFYKILNGMTDASLVPGSTDFRLIDKSVQSEFVRLTERNRITRGLIDWLGFSHAYIYFKASARMAGEASYSTSKLIKLALDSFVSLSLKPLYFAAYAGLVILPLATLVLIFSIVEMLVGDPIGLHITGSAYLVLIALCMIGVLLVSQGIIAIYLSHIHSETQNRPLFIIDEATSSEGPTQTVKKL